MIGREFASTVRDRYGTSDLKTIAYGEGIKVIFPFRWRARFGEFILERLIMVPRDTSLGERRARIAHALGHHFLHLGNQRWLRKLDKVWVRKQEHQAEEFAAFLTIPVADEPYLTGLPVSEVARIYRVTEDLARRRAVA